MKKVECEIRTFTGRREDGHREKLYTFINKDQDGNIISVRYQVDKNAYKALRAFQPEKPRGWANYIPGHKKPSELIPPMPQYENK